MPILVLLHHGQSEWNLESRFTEWAEPCALYLQRFLTYSSRLKLAKAPHDAVVPNAPSALNFFSAQTRPRPFRPDRVVAAVCDDHRGVLREIAKHVRFDLVFFLFGVVSGHIPAGVSPRFLDDAPFAEAPERSLLPLSPKRT
jgi:hypothetical protein